jgi:hypothetical protein
MAQWLRHCATNRRVAGSIPDGVTGIFIDIIEKNEMSGTCSSDGRREACTRFWWGNLWKRDHWEDPCVDGRIILRRIFMK